jgi:hypothetical protein
MFSEKYLCAICGNDFSDNERVALIRSGELESDGDSFEFIFDIDDNYNIEEILVHENCLNNKIGW